MNYRYLSFALAITLGSTACLDVESSDTSELAEETDALSSRPGLRQRVAVASSLFERFIPDGDFNRAGPWVNASHNRPSPTGTVTALASLSVERNTSHQQTDMGRLEFVAMGAELYGRVVEPNQPAPAYRLIPVDIGDPDAAITSLDLIDWGDRVTIGLWRGSNGWTRDMGRLEAVLTYEYMFTNVYWGFNSPPSITSDDVVAGMAVGVCRDEPYEEDVCLGPAETVPNHVGGDVIAQASYVNYETEELIQSVWFDAPAGRYGFYRFVPVETATVFPPFSKPDKVVTSIDWGCSIRNDCPWRGPMSETDLMNGVIPVRGHAMWASLN